MRMSSAPRLIALEGGGWWLVALFVCLALIAPEVERATAAAPVETVARFDTRANEHPENVLVTLDGTVYVSLHEAATIWRRGADGTTAVIAIPGASPRTTRANGLALTRDGLVHVAVTADDSALAGVWRIAPDGSVRKEASLPARSGINGMAADDRDNLYITDDALGVIWRVPSGAANAEVWLHDPALRPDPNGAAYPGARAFGANGVKVFRGAVFVSNPSQAAMLRVPIAPDGAAGGSSGRSPASRSATRTISLSTATGPCMSPLW